MILIISNKEDIHLNPVIDVLIEKEAKFFRLNTEELLNEYEVFWVIENGLINFSITNNISGHKITNKDITSIWERRPEIPFLKNSETSEQIKKLCVDEAWGFLKHLRYSLNDCFWLINPINELLACSKILQIKIANELGIKTPDCIYSNKKEDILKFSEKYQYLALKPIYNNDIFINDNNHVFWTKKINKSDLLELSDFSISQTINFIQPYIEKDYELRVTVVGDKIFPCKIESQFLSEEKGKSDWRQGYDHGLKYSHINLSKELEDFCLNFLKKLNLNFGCFDFIVTPKNEFIFLECNPNGQWLWIEEELNLPISEAIADILINNKA